MHLINVKEIKSYDMKFKDSDFTVWFFKEYLINSLYVDKSSEEDMDVRVWRQPLLSIMVIFSSLDKIILYSSPSMCPTMT